MIVAPGKLSQTAILLLLLAVSLFIGLTAARYGYFSILTAAALCVAALTLIRPVETNICILGVWGVFQGTLAGIHVGGIPFSQIVIVSIIAPLFIGLLARGRTVLSNRGNRLVTVYAWWTLWNAIGVLTTVFVSEAIVEYSRFLIGAMIFVFFALGMKNARETNRVAAVIVICGVISAAVTILQFAAYNAAGITALGHFEVVRHYYGNAYRPVGTFDGPVASAIALYAMYLIAGYKYLRTRRSAYLIAAVMMAAGMLCTLTRTTAVALLLTIVFQAVQLSFRRRNPGPVVKIVSIVVLLSSLIFAFALPVVEKRFVDITDATSVDGLGAGRVGIWIGIVKGIANESGAAQVLIGNGISAGRLFVSKYSVFGYQDYTHNDYLDIVVSNGILSLFMLLLFIVLIFRLIRSGSQDVRLGFFFPVLFYFSVIMMLSNTNYSAGQRWFFLLLLAYVINAVKWDSGRRERMGESGRL